MLDDDGKLRQRFCNKRVNAAKENIPFELSFEQFCDKLKDAGIKSSDLGVAGFQLARHEDTGAYASDNCRFISHTANAREKKITDKMRKASSSNIRAYNFSLTKEERLQRAQRAQRTKEKRGTCTGGHNRLPDTEIHSRLEKISSIDLSKRGCVTAISQILGVSHTQAIRFLKSQGLR